MVGEASPPLMAAQRAARGYNSFLLSTEPVWDMDARYGLIGLNFYNYYNLLISIISNKFIKLMIYLSFLQILCKINR